MTDASSESDDKRERAHFAGVLRSFDSYLAYCLAANNARRKSFYSLPRAHQHLLADIGPALPLPLLDQDSEAPSEHPSSGPLSTGRRGFTAKLDEIDDRIRRNADLLSQIVQDSRGFLGQELTLNGEQQDLEASSSSPAPTHDATTTIATAPSVPAASPHQQHAHNSDSPAPTRKKRKISGSEVDKVQSILKQLVRDWSKEGQAERDHAYAPIITAIEARFATVPRHELGRVNILVPGAGLGRLAFDLASHGYSCQGNEFSFYMLLASHHILNKTTTTGQHTIYPFIHTASNWRSADDMLRPVQIPDILPSQLPPTSDFSMVAGEFCEVYSKPDEKAAWNAVATCFFIDTARNVVRYLETLNHVLPVGGYWINAGPLLWHFENSGGPSGGADNLSIELTLDEVLHLCTKLGFEVEEHSALPPMTYTGVLNGMLTYNYRPEFFVCRKVRDVNPAPSV